MSFFSEKSHRELFIEKYVNYILCMEHESCIAKMDNYFYQLILFLHPNSEKYNDPKISHKIKENCLFINKTFDDKFLFNNDNNNGNESAMFLNYVANYCPLEITEESTINNPQVQKFYGCDFTCPTTFECIVRKLKTLGYSKEKLVNLQNEAKQLRRDGHENEYNNKMTELKRNMLIVKNICLFISANK